MSGRDWEAVKTFLSADCVYVDMPVGPTLAARGPDDIVKPGLSARTCAKNASTSAGPQSHGYWPVNSVARLGTHAVEPA